jgi:hypothetical protein
MATRSTIGYETADGGYVGVYCHYDGNPEHQMPILRGMYHADVVILVSRALQGGGIRFLSKTGDHEIYPASGRPIEAETDWPYCAEDYAYIKRLDGRVEWVSHGQKTPVEWDR